MSTTSASGMGPVRRLASACGTRARCGGSGGAPCSTTRWYHVHVDCKAFQMLRARKNVISETIDGEVIMIDLETGVYYSLSGTAGQVWTAIEAGGGRTGSVAAMTACYGEEVSPAVLDFIDTLVEEGVVTDVDGDDGTPPPPVEAGPFVSPVLERYTDMAALLWLDPVHDVDEEVGWPTTR